MFTVHGFYEIAKARKTNYFIKLKEWNSEDGEWTYFTVGFSENKSVDLDKYFGLETSGLRPDEKQFMSVEECDSVFKSHP